MQKALKLMNIQLPEVLSDVTGVTGMAILRAIVAGERRADVLAKLRRPGCRRTEEDIIHALTGTWRDEHLFVLAQSLDLYDFYTTKITDCDHRLDQQFSSMKPRFDIEGEPPAPPASRTKKNSNSKNQPAYNVRAHLVRLLGIDLVDIIGCVKEHPGCSGRDIQHVLNMSPNKTVRLLRWLKSRRILHRRGASKNSGWYLNLRSN